MKKAHISLAAAMLAISSFVLVSSLSASPYLIEYSWGKNSAPAEAVKHKDFIETLPFDGMVFRETAGLNLMNTNFTIGNRVGRSGIKDGIWTYEQCMASFAPLSKEKPSSYYFKNVSHNFGMMYWKVNAGLFSDTDWVWVLENYKNYARACKDLGLTGIIIDDEINSNTIPSYWNYYDNSEANSPPNHLYYTGRTLKECHMQARLRGKQVMDAIISEFPNAAVLIMHGPYRSSWVSNAAKNSNKAPNPPTLVNHCLGNWCVDSLLDGSFGAGLVEASGLQKTSPHSLAIDGGELYELRTLAEFQDNYQWRKYGILDPAIGKTVYPTHPVNFLDDSLRAIWSKNTSISYGVYDKERFYDPIAKKYGNWQVITDMNLVRTTLANSLRVADDYVWHYTESFDWFCDPNPATQSIGDMPPASKAWIEAIRLGRQDAAKDSKTSKPTSNKE